MLACNNRSTSRTKGLRRSTDYAPEDESIVIGGLSQTHNQSFQKSNGHSQQKPSAVGTKQGTHKPKIMDFFKKTLDNKYSVANSPAVGKSGKLSINCYKVGLEHKRNELNDELMKLKEASMSKLSS